MHNSLKIALASSLATLFATVALAKDNPAAPLKREGKWVLNYADGACHLSGAFGTASDQVIIHFSQAGPGQWLRLNLYGKPLGKSFSTFSEARVSFLPTTEKPNWRPVTNGTIKRPEGILPAVFLGGIRLDNRSSPEGDELELPPVDAATEQAVYALSVTKRGGGALIFDLQTMGPPMQAMRVCIDNLIRHWGFDPAELQTRQSRATPTGNPAKWATTDDYPAKMVFNGTSAFVTFKVNVDERGSVADCVVLEATNPPEIGSHTCRLIEKRAKFAPARDKDGKPVKDFYVNRVFWRAY